jgi:RHS repeat-associated protein
LYIFVVRFWHGSKFAYDTAGLLVSAGDLALTRDAQNGRLTGSTLNTVNDSWNYTGFGEAQSYVAAAASTALYAMSFTRDHAGRISTKTETLGGVTSVYTSTYDAARGWLTDVSSNGLPTAHYDYDDNGNRTDALTLDREVSYAAADGQDRITGGTLAQPLQAAQNVSWSYTANGEVSGRTAGTATTLYSYDVRGNLRDVTLTNGVRIEYLVDATGRRLGRKVGGTLTRGWLYQDGLKPVAELDGAGNVVSRFVYGGKANVPEYVVKNGAEYRLITDQLGSVRLVVNAADGSLAQRLDYDEFGRVLNDSNPGFQPFGYAGGLYDPDTGLVRFGARDYDADAGRWMSKDPIGFDGGDNWYAYVGNNPINWLDYFGLLLTPEQIGNIVFRETRSLSGNEINDARYDLAQTIINADKRWGDDRSKYAKTASTDTPKVYPGEEQTYIDAQAAAKKAACDNQKGIDSTEGSTNFDLSDNPLGIGALEIMTGYIPFDKYGPFNNAYPNSKYPKAQLGKSVYINVYPPMVRATQ